MLRGGAWAWMLVAGSALAQPCAPDQVVAEAAAGPVAFTVEIADDAAEQARGLMFRPSLAPDRGMLFVFDEPRVAGFWMRNTMIPLDMVFVDAAGTVVNVAARTEPYSERLIASAAPVRAVLEIAGGRAAEVGIGPGTRLRHPAFGPGACGG